ncbi:MAG: hypothetical protein ACE15B_19365 [Bryobacteraceae bacterium]
MSIGEAIAVNAVLAGLLGQKRALDTLGLKIPEMQSPGGTRLSHEKLRDHAILLADKAHKTLQSGVDGEQVRRLWNGGRE